MFKYSIEANHPAVTLDNFTVLSSGYSNRNFKRKVSESLFIKHNRSTLNKNDTSVTPSVSEFQSLTVLEKTPFWILDQFRNAPLFSILMSLYYPFFLLRAPLRIWEGAFCENSRFHSLTIFWRKLHLWHISECTSLNSTMMLLYYHYYYSFFIYFFAVLSFCYFIIISHFDCFK